MTIEVKLREWESWAPRSGEQGWGASLDDEAAREDARRLTQAGLLGVLETHDGLRVDAFSFVGRVQFGSLAVTIRPKLQGLPLWTLMRYAFDLRALKRFAPATHQTAVAPFHDLLVAQIVNEAAELLARGAHRDYLPRHEDLSSPHGRIDFGVLARRSGAGTATLPCRLHVRSEDCLVNQVLRSGLRLGARTVSDPDLAVACRRVDQQLEESVSEVDLNARTFAVLNGKMNRLTRVYRPVIELIALLAGSASVQFEGSNLPTPLPGFLFDMNAFFQRLISRFLHDGLPGFVVSDEHRLHEMMQYLPEFNPRSKRAPALRPDFAIMEKGKIVALLDAKYRDLWERDLPRDMLYQLAVYALSREPGGSATILYPTLSPEAREARIDIRDPIRGAGRSTVILRPVDMVRLSRLVTVSPSGSLAGERQAYARQLCFGSSVSEVAA